MRVWRTLALPSCNNMNPVRRHRPKFAGFCAVVLSAAALLYSPLTAQTSYSTAPTNPKPQRSTRRPATVDDRVKVFAKALDLGEPQQAAVKKILEERQQETLRLRTDSSIPANQRIDRFRALQDQTVYKIRAVLNDEQKKKYDPLAVRKINPPPDQKSVEDWLKLTTPKK